MKKSISIILAIAKMIFAPMATANNSDWIEDLPSYTTATKIGDSVHVNGIPTKMIAIAATQPLQKLATYFHDQWSVEGWSTNIHKAGDSIIVSAFNKSHQKSANLIKTSENTSEGSLSITDMPKRLLNGTGPDYILAEHLPKPKNTLVINEVKIRDVTGESIMTTLVNYYDSEQNVAYYRERMFELGWREKSMTKTKEKSGAVLIFSKPEKEANFTIYRQNKQTYIVVNSLSK